MNSTTARGRAAVILAALVLTVTAACGAVSSGDSLVGTEWAAGLETGDQLVVAFTSDTDCELITVEGGEREVDDADATWVLEGDIVTVSGDGSEFEFVLDGDTLTLSDGGQDIVFEKQ